MGREYADPTVKFKRNAYADAMGSSSGRRALLALEFAAVFIALPLAFAARVLPVPLFPALWVLTAICLGAFLSFDGLRRRLYIIH